MYNNKDEIYNWSSDDLVEVKLPDEDSFLKIKETLTRIGIANQKTRTLYQSCHILHKQNRYFIVHFKELFALDGKQSNITVSDIQRRNAIVQLLEQWELLNIVNKNKVKDYTPFNMIKILTYKDKDDWELVAKYTIGRNKRS